MVAEPASLSLQRRRSRGGFALAELMISTAIFTSVSAGLILGFISLKRCYAATADFAINHSDQMRISDYLAMDLRRAISVTAVRNDASIKIPCYYDATPSHSVQTPMLDGKGGVYYGAADCFVTVRYYLAGSVIYRKEGSEAAAGIAIDVQDFDFDATDLGKVVKTSITFKPTYRSSGASEAVKTATAFHNTTLLRNNRTDVLSGVY
jgi:type II secretory pathway component PulJ